MDTGLRARKLREPVGTHVPAHRRAPPSKLGEYLAAIKNDQERKQIAFWLYERWGVKSGILEVWLDRPRSTLMGWIRKLQQEPAEFQARILAAFDESVRL